MNHTRRAPTSSASMSLSPDPAVTVRPAWFWWAHQSPFKTSVRGPETSTHRLHIGGYSTLSTVYERGNGIESKVFRVGGHRWKLMYYPNGYPGSKSGSPGVALILMDKRGFFSRATNVTPGINVLVLDRDGNELCHRYRCIQQHLSRSCCSAGLWVDVRQTVGTVEESKEALCRLRDDTLVVWCQVTVEWTEKLSRLRWLLRH